MSLEISLLKIIIYIFRGGLFTSQGGEKCVEFEPSNKKNNDILYNFMIIFMLIFYSPRLFSALCVCVCVWERERERERESLD